MMQRLNKLVAEMWRNKGKVLLGFVLVGMLWVFLEPWLVSVAAQQHNSAIRPEFEEQRAQWLERNITHYRVTEDRFPRIMVLCPPRQVEVREGKIIAAVPVFEGDRPPELDEYFSKSCWSPGEDGPIENLFMVLERILVGGSSDQQPLVKVEYDPTYGYPSHVTLYDPAMSDNSRYILTDFELLDP
jgi:hypothetical protein